MKKSITLSPAFARNWPTLSSFIGAMRESIADGYLPANWHQIACIAKRDALMLTEHDRIILESDRIETSSGSIWHRRVDEGEQFVELADGDDYMDKDDAVWGFYRRGEGWLDPDDSQVYLLDCDYYHENSFHYRDIVWLEDGGAAFRDDAYLWSDGGYRDYEEPDSDDEDEEDDYDKIYPYHSGYMPKDYRKYERDEITIGFEIEKNEMPTFRFDKHELKDMGFVIERDGSVSSGFELKTPIYRLYDPFTDEDLKKIEGFCNVKNVSGAGGHVNVGINGKRDEEILDAYRGWMPVIYALYAGRLRNSYCSGKKPSAMKKDKDKYQAVALHGNYIEFRIVSAVKSFDNLMWRLGFFRIISKHLNKSFFRVLRLLMKDEEVRTHLRKVYSEEKLNKVIAKAIDMHLDYGDNITKHASGTYNKIKEKLLPKNQVAQHSDIQVGAIVKDASLVTQLIDQGYTFNDLYDYTSDLSIRHAGWRVMALPAVEDEA